MERPWGLGDSLTYEPPLPEFLQSAPDRVKNSFLNLHKVGIDSDITEVVKATSDVNTFLMDSYIEKNFTNATNLSPRDLVGFEAAGSVLRRLYPSPFQISGFLSENYSPAVKARRELWKEVDRDGFVLKSTSKSPKYVREALDFLNNFSTNGRDCRYLINKLRDNVSIFGNFLVYRFTDRRKKYKQERGDLLLMEKCSPLFETDNDLIRAWQYFHDNQVTVFSPSELDHQFTYSARTNVMGQPILSSLVVDIEAALHWTIYNNTVMQKGGMMRGILALKDIGNGSQVINDKTYIDLAEQLTKWYDRRFGGIRGSGQIAVGPFVDKFFDLGKIGEMDGAGMNLSDRVAVMTCEAFGVPPERAGYTRGSQYKNTAEVFDSIALGLDNEIYYTTQLVFDYLNMVLAENGYGDVTIEGKGEFSSTSKAAAEFLEKIALAYKNSGALTMTVNEFRTRIMRWNSLENEIGDKFIGEVMSADDPRQVQERMAAIGKPASNAKRYEDRTGIYTYCPKELAYFGR